MRNKIKNVLLFVAMFALAVPTAYAAAVDFDDEMEDLSAAAVAEYDVSGSLFQQITDLEQEKVLMQLEKERAQLDLELDRLAAEKIKLHMEIDTLSGRAEAAAAELETEKAKLAAEAARLAREKEALESAEKDVASTPRRASSSARAAASNDDGDENLSDKYKLINVIGAGNQLQATIVDINSGQSKRISVGKTVDGFAVKSISLEDGVVFIKDGETQTLNVVGKN